VATIPLKSLLTAEHAAAAPGLGHLWGQNGPLSDLSDMDVLATYLLQQVHAVGHIIVGIMLCCAWAHEQHTYTIFMLISACLCMCTRTTHIHGVYADLLCMCT